MKPWTLLKLAICFFTSLYVCIIPVLMQKMHFVLIFDLMKE